MTRQLLLKALAVAGIAVVAFASPKAVKADALPCTVMYLNQAKEAQSNATAELAAAQSALAAVQAQVDSFVARGEVNTQAYFDAATQLLAAKGNVEAKQQALSSANSFVKDCTSKYVVEDNADHAYKALQDLNVVQSIGKFRQGAVLVDTVVLAVHRLGVVGLPQKREKVSLLLNGRQGQSLLRRQREQNAASR